MPTELTFALFKYGLLVLLWVFVWLAVMSLKRDVTVLSDKARRGKRRQRRRRRREKREFAARGFDSNAANTVAGQLETASMAASESALNPTGNTSNEWGGVASSSTPIHNGKSSSTPAQEGYSTIQSNRVQPTMLVIIDGPLVGTSASLSEKTITIGRAPNNTVVLDDEFASSHHAKIYSDASGQWILEDLGSTNGTTLNNQPVQGAIFLYPHQPVRIGATTFELR